MRIEWIFCCCLQLCVLLHNLGFGKKGLGLKRGGFFFCVGTLQLVFSLFLPCLIFTQLGKSVTIEKILEWYATLLSTHICAQIKIKNIKLNSLTSLSPCSLDLDFEHWCINDCLHAGDPGGSFQSMWLLPPSWAAV
jgi:hypothetical protein